MDAALSETLPQHAGFIRSYVEYAASCSDAPAIYHVGVGLTTFAAAVAHHVRCPWIAGRELMPNLYTLIVGDSQSGRKTSSMDAGAELVHGGPRKLAVPTPGSYEELIAQVRRQSYGVLYFREFGHFLKATQRGYAEPMRTVLMDLYDWPAGVPFTRNLRTGPTVIEGPICLSMLGAISCELLFQYADSAEWFGGFFGRMLLLHGQRQGFSMPRAWPEARNYLTQFLTAWADFAPAACGGFHPAAWQYLEHWARQRDEQSQKAPPRMRHFLSGVTTLAAKISLLYAVDSGECNAGYGWVVSPESVYRAVLLVDNLYLESVTTLADRLTLSQWEEARRRVLDVLERAGEIGVTRRDLLRRVKFPSTMLDETLETLRDEETVEQLTGSMGASYRLVDAQRFRPSPIVSLANFGTRTNEA